MPKLLLCSVGQNYRNTCLRSGETPELLLCSVGQNYRNTCLRSGETPELLLCGSELQKHLSEIGKNA